MRPITQNVRGYAIKVRHSAAPVRSAFFVRDFSLLDWALAAVLIILVACDVWLFVTTQPAVVKHSEFINWPRELRSRAPSLAYGIAQDVAEYPLAIWFPAPDTLEIRFWNPFFWREDRKSKGPYENEYIRGMAGRVAELAWFKFGRDAGVKAIQVMFIRVRSEPHVWRLGRTVEAKEVFELFSSEMLESGKPESTMISIVQRDSSAWLRLRVTPLEARLYRNDELTLPPGDDSLAGK